MASRQFQQFFFSLNPMITFIEGNFVVGSSGAVGTLKGSGVASVTRLSAGTYQIQLQDNYYRYLSGYANFVAPPTGSPVADGSFVTGTTYTITTVGTTNWAAAGLNSQLTPTVNQSFVATSAGGSGTGTATAVGKCNILSTQLVGDPNTMLNPPPNPLLPNQGGIVIFQCITDADAVADPTAGSVCGFTLTLRNSSIKGKGE